MENHTFNYKWKKLPSETESGTITASCLCSFTTEISGIEYSTGSVTFSEELEKLCFSYSFEHNDTTHTMLDTETTVNTSLTLSVQIPTKGNQLDSVDISTYSTKTYSVDSNNYSIAIFIDGSSTSLSAEEISKCVDKSVPGQLTIKFGYNQTTGDCYLIGKEQIIIKVTNN